MFKQFLITAKIDKDIETVWHTYHLPLHIQNWNFASEDWHCPNATSEFKEDGRFNYRMESKDKSYGFDFSGTFKIINQFKMIKYQLDDQREVVIEFENHDYYTEVKVLIDAEEENSIALQKRGWQAIINRFKYYVESLT
jgi:uncharacterized protein YndB with AHSA1/START domain